MDKVTGLRKQHTVELLDFQGGDRKVIAVAPLGSRVKS
jgi:hypothetical protein